MRRSIGYLLLGSVLACQQPDPNLKKTKNVEPTTEAVTNQEPTSQGPVIFARLGRFDLKEWEFFLSIQMATEMLTKQGATPKDLENYKDMIRERSKEATIEGFIISAVLAREAERRGEKASPEEISAERAKQFKDRKPPANATEADISAVIERNILANRMITILESDVTLTDAEAEKVYREALTEEELEYIVTSAPTEPTAEQVSEYAKAHAAEVKAYYDANQKDFILPEAVKVRHIVLKLPLGATDEDEKAPKAKIEDIAAQLTEGRLTFEEAAKQFSEDASSKDQGGELGWLSRGQMLKKFEAAVSTLQPGQISKVVKTEVGFHIINLEEKREAKPQELAAVEAEIAAQLLKADNKLAKDQAQAILDQVKAGKKLPEIAASFTPPLEAKKSGTFSLGQKSIPGLGSEPTLVDAIHALTLEKPYPDAPLALGQGFVVPVLIRKEDPDMAPYEKQKEQIKQAVLSNRKKEKGQNWIKQARKDEAPYFEVNRSTLPEWKN